MTDSRDLCDHDICMCGETFTDVHGYERTVIPHPGTADSYFRLDEYDLLEES